MDWADDVLLVRGSLLLRWSEHYFLLLLFEIIIVGIPSRIEWMKIVYIIHFAVVIQSLKQEYSFINSVINNQYHKYNLKGN